MKVNYIKTVGFRKFKSIFETHLYDVTNITGKNRAGKTNILYAIVNIMLGTNLSGDEKSCLIHKSCGASYGELHFTDNKGIEHILIRGKDRYDNNKNFISLDGKVVTQKDLVKFYKDKKLFLSILNPLYFLSKKPAEQKELVDKYLNDICPENMMEIAYNNLSEDEQKCLEGIPTNIPEYISESNAEIKRIESKISELDGKIEYAQNTANEKLEEYKTFEKDEELALAEQELSYLNIDEKAIDKEKQRKVVEEIEKNISNMENEFSELDKSMKLGKQEYLSIKNSQTCTCPTCKQKIQDESKITTLQNMHKDLMEKYNKRILLEEQIKDKKIKLATEKCNYHSLDGKPDVEKEKRIEVVKKTINQLKQEKQEIDYFNNEITIKEKNINNAKLSIENFNKERKEKLKLIDTLKQTKKVAQKLYILYIEEKMKLAKQYLKDVNIKFYSVLKESGEIKEDFIITYKNNTLADLSRSETIATALEFAYMFNKISNTNFPIFVDDYESCADYDFIKEYSKETQLLVSKVEKGKALKIADFNSNKFTAIKPVIKGCKTIKVHKKAAEISHAA